MARPASSDELKNYLVSWLCEAAPETLRSWAPLPEGPPKGWQERRAVFEINQSWRCLKWESERELHEEESRDPLDTGCGCNVWGILEELSRACWSKSDAKGLTLMAMLSSHSHQRDRADAVGACRNRSFLFFFLWENNILYRYSLWALLMHKKQN